MSKTHGPNFHFLKIKMEDVIMKAYLLANPREKKAVRREFLVCLFLA